MADLTVGRIPKAIGPTVIGDSSIIDTGSVVIFGVALKAPTVIVAETPASGDTVTMGDTQGLYVNTALLAALTIRLPPSPIAGQMAELNFAAPVTALTLQDSAGVAIANAPTNAFGPGAAIFMRYVTGAGWVYWK